MDNITAVKDKIDIVELISSYVPLKRSGKNFKGVCPFHNEKTPSFMVSEELQRYRCFGCGKGGDVFNFIMEIEGVEFGEALRTLADKAGIKLDLKPNSQLEKEKQKAQKILDMNKLASKFYSHLLITHEYGKEALEYLKNREIKSSTIKTFQMGYAPKSWDNLSRYLLSKGYSSADIDMSGLGKLRKNGNSTYDIFRGRLMFPLFDHMGQIIGFSGRALSKDQEPKYINSPETAIFHKERFLFGLNLAKTSIRQEKQAIIVEGEFDMISPYQKGYKNIVATKGTALTLGQINLLKRYTDTIVFIFDNDLAGLEASIRGIALIKNADLNIKVAILPNDIKDPDELVVKDDNLFKEVVKKAIPLWDYYFVYANTKYDFSNVFEKKKASTFLLNMINGIDDEVIKRGYIKKFAVAFEVSEEDVKKQLEKTTTVTFVRDGDEESPRIMVNGGGLEVYPSSEVYFLTLITNISGKNMNVYLDLIDEECFSNENTKSLYLELKKIAGKGKGFDIKVFHDKLSQGQGEVYNLFEKIYLIDLGLEDETSNLDFLEKEIVTAVNRLKVDSQKRLLKSTAFALRKAEAISDAKLIAKLQKQAQEITSKLSGLSLK